MNPKNLLKILAISFGIVVVILAGLALWGLSLLPSAFDIRQAATPPALKTDQTVETQSANENAAKNEVLLEQQQQKNLTENEEAEKYKINRDIEDVLRNDFANSTKPLVDVCGRLSETGRSRLFRDSQNASAKVFFDNLTKADKDPLVESAAPIFRYILRGPGGAEILEMVYSAQRSQDSGLLKKAEFYYEIYRLGEFLKNHQSEMNVLLQKTYNLHHMMKAIDKKPELAKDPAVVDYCRQMEELVNEQGPYDAEAASLEMVKFLSQAGVSAQEINYDAKFRSNLKLNLSRRQAGLGNIWIESLFARDIEKAQKPSQ